MLVNIEVGLGNFCDNKKVWWNLCRYSFKTGSKTGSMSSKKHHQQTTVSIGRIAAYSDR
jgi:hypothetical protein